MIADRVYAILSELGPGAVPLAKALRSSILKRESWASVEGRERIGGLLKLVKQELGADQAALGNRLTELGLDIMLGDE